MSGFDIAPAVETVGVRGKNYRVLGLDVEHIGQLFRDFPEVRKMIGAKAVDVGVLMKMSSRLINAIIAAGLRDVLAESDVGSIKNLMLGEKAKIIAAIVRLTMPDGLGPFVDLMNALGLTASAESAQSEPPKIIKLRARTSSERPSTSLQNADTRAAMS